MSRWSTHASWSTAEGPQECRFCERSTKEDRSRCPGEPCAPRACPTQPTSRLAAVANLSTPAMGTTPLPRGGAARDLRRNPTTTSATLVLLSLSLALYGAVLLAGGQLKLVASFVASTAINQRCRAWRPIRSLAAEDRSAGGGRPLTRIRAIVAA